MQKRIDGLGPKEIVRKLYGDSEAAVESAFGSLFVNKKWSGVVSHTFRLVNQVQGADDTFWTACYR